jgi:hypothetical protein
MEPKQFVHQTFLDFTKDEDYKNPLQKSKKLFKNNQSNLSDFKTFQMFDNDGKESILHSRIRTKSLVNLSNNFKPDSQSNRNVVLEKELRLLNPSDPLLNSTSRKELKYSSRNNMESHSYLNDLSKF